MRALILCLLLSGCVVTIDEWETSIKACESSGGLRHVIPSSIGKYEAVCKNGSIIQGTLLPKS